jgi:hypothetical protein
MTKLGEIWADVIWLCSGRRQLITVMSHISLVAVVQWGSVAKRSGSKDGLVTIWLYVGQLYFYPVDRMKMKQIKKIYCTLSECNMGEGSGLQKACYMCHAKWALRVCYLPSKLTCSRYLSKHQGRCNIGILKTYPQSNEVNVNSALSDYYLLPE